MGKTKIKTIDESVQKPEEKVEKTVEKVTSTEKKEKVSKRAKKKTITIPNIRGKKYQEARGQVETNKKYSLKEAVELVQKTSYSKFPGTLEAHINTTAKNLRGLVTLPHFAGKKLTVLAFGSSAEESGADLVGTEETVEEINEQKLLPGKPGSKDKINFDVIVATPDWMPKLAKVARILGPRGLMPNPKSGTVTDNLTKAIAELKTGKVEYKTEKDGQVVHMAIGKTTQDIGEVAENIKALYNILGRSKIKKITLSSTMGPGVKVELSSI